MTAFFLAVGSIIGVLFPVLNPIGNVFFAMETLKDIESKRERHQILVRETAFAFGILFFFLFCGSPVLKFLNIDNESLRMTGGALLVIIAIPMVFPKPRRKADKFKEKPFLVPIATPLTAGPSSITMTILLSSSYSYLQMIAALIFMFLLVCSFYWGGEWIVGFLGKKGTEAVGRLMGLLLVAIAIQMLSTGLVSTVSRVHTELHKGDQYTYVLIEKARLESLEDLQDRVDTANLSKRADELSREAASKPAY